MVVGTLLGPEGADMSVSSAGPAGSRTAVLHAWGAGLAGLDGRVTWLLVENCTVDASIFFLCFAEL